MEECRMLRGISNLWVRRSCLLLALMARIIPHSSPRAVDQDVPHDKVDASWPKPLPNEWTIGGIGGMTVDKNDNIWIYHRPNTITADEASAAQKPPAGICCFRAPA